MINTMPVLTEGQRQSLIADCKAEIADLEGFIETYKPKFTDNYSATSLFQIKSQLLRQQIALASLEAKGKTMRRAKDDDRTWVECGKDYYLGRTFYFAPPVPALKLPKYADSSNVPFAANGWNAAIDEVKKLNGVTE